MAKLYFTFVLSMLVQVAFGQDLQSTIEALQSKPYDTSVANNQEIFNQYCTGEADSIERPSPKYDNPLVASAATLLQKSKVDADSRLQELIAKNWINQLNGITTELTNMQQSSYPEIQKLAGSILGGLSAESPGLSYLQKKEFDQIAAFYLSLIGEATSGIANIASEFTPVDFAVVTTVIDSLAAQLAAQLKVIPLNKTLITSSLSLFKSEIAHVNGTFDSAATVSAFTGLRDIVAAMTLQPNSDLSLFVEQINGYIKDLNSSVDPQSVAWYLRDVLYYSNPSYKLPPEAIPYFKVVAQQWTYLSKNSTLDQIISLEQMIKQGNVDYNYYLSDVKGLMENYAVNSTNAQFVDTLAAYSGHVTELSQNEAAVSLLKSVKKFQINLKDGDTSNDINGLSEFNWGSWSYDQVKSQLDQEVQDLYAKLVAEAKKTDQDFLKEEIASLVSSMATMPKTMQGYSENMYTIQNVSSSLDQLLPAFSAGSQIAVKKFVDAVNASRSLESLYYSAFYESGGLTESEHFYFYGGVRRIYKTYNGEQPFGDIAHTFLVQLCGEFRDRASMIEAKIKWINRMYTLPVEQITTSVDFSKNIWEQMSAPDYYPYLEVTEALWQARKSSASHHITIGKYDTVDTPVVGPTVCETKYIFEKYVKKNVPFDDLEAYTNDYEASYRSLCSKEDQEDYYDFRGDSNFKHYSPESNAMIWRALSVARACDSQEKAKVNLQDGAENQFSDSVCSDYFRRPFFYRYNSARSALATGLFYDSAYDSNFDSQGNAAVTVYSNLSPQLAPMAFDLGDDNPRFEFDVDWLSLQGWNRSDIGFNEWTGLGQENANLELAYERLRGSVDRHTNWYSAGYKDSNGDVRGQAFSPFVASSYVMRASDAFTTCGITVNCPPDGLKRWMFIFRIKPQNWYHPQRLLNGEPVNFDTMWFDETSFGDSGLANHENAWDRLGTAMESELDSILYLINVEGGGFEGEFEGDMEGFSDFESDSE